MSTKGLVLDAVWENDIYEPKYYRNIAVFGLTQNREDNEEYENKAVKYFKSKGIKAIAGHEIYDIHTEGKINSTHLKRYMFSLGFDGILTSTLLHSDGNEDMTDEELEHYSEGIYKFGEYFQVRYTDALTADKELFAILESNFYMIMDYNDFDGSGLAWISHYQISKEIQENFQIDEYAKTIVKSLFEDQVILKKKPENEVISIPTQP
ncbi:hypothetical protein BFP72_09065 [Reichenbachiella sp. 5M10]|nr:hypothetical protein BFP72_09065 [Reichenbachiella sp. 5M10]